MLATRVLQTAVAPGSATTINLVAPATGWRSFVAAFGSGASVFYSIEDLAAGQWEEGEGTVTAGSPDTLTRTTVLRNSLGTNARINFAGTPTVFNTLFAPTATGRGVFFATDAAAARTAINARSIYAGSIATTSGAAHGWTALPADIQWMELLVSGVRTAVNAQVLVELGHGTGPTYVTTGYSGAAAIAENATATQAAVVTAGFPLLSTAAARIGALRLRRTTPGAHTWIADGQINPENIAAIGSVTGAVTLPAELTAVRITTGSSFNLGSINLAYGF